jgi:hypothetical protein
VFIVLFCGLALVWIFRGWLLKRFATSRLELRLVCAPIYNKRLGGQICNWDKALMRIMGLGLVDGYYDCWNLR